MPGDPAAPPSDGVFTVGRRGYDPQQVDAHLRRLDAEIRILVADRDAAVDQATQLGRELNEARQRADRLRTQVRTMAGKPSDVQGMSERMRTMLRLAEDEVADMLRRADEEVAGRLAEADKGAEQVVAAARAQAADIVAAARAEAERTDVEAARRRGHIEAACAADRQAVAAERVVAEQAVARAAEEAERERAQAWAESEARRAVVEEDFAIAMDQRRTEALADVRAERARTADWVRRTGEETTRQVRAELAAAEQTARRIVAAAQARATELTDLRARIAGQLRGTRAELDDALAALSPSRTQPPSSIAEEAELPPVAPLIATPSPAPALPPTPSEKTTPSIAVDGPALNAPAPEAAVPVRPAGPPTLILDSTTLEPPRSTRTAELEPVEEASTQTADVEPADAASDDSAADDRTPASPADVPAVDEVGTSPEAAPEGAASSGTDSSIDPDSPDSAETGPGAAVRRMWRSAAGASRQ